MTYYKVIWINDAGKVVSFNTPSKELEVDYVLYREVVAPVGGLLAFDRLHLAKKFCWRNDASGLFQCDGSEPVPLPESCFMTLRYRIGKILTESRHDTVVRQIIEDLWRGVYHHDLANYGPWPEGTVAIRRLRPIKYIPVRPWGWDE